MMKVNWLKQKAKDGKFKGLEMELARTIMEIIIIDMNLSKMYSQ
jgi:hypothetical protein